MNAGNSPIQGAVVNFSISNADVTLNITQATSDAEGVVVTTVTSGTRPTAVVVTATAATNSSASVPSSSLSVSNGLVMVGGFEIVAEKYNIDGGTTGASTTISAFLRDAAGNLVLDGTVVSFTTDYGAVGTSSAGSCSTSNGTCSVPFRVQEPRGTGIATVTGTVQLPGNTVPLADSVSINMSSSQSARALLADGSVATNLNLVGTCKNTFTLFAGDSRGNSLAQGTGISALAAGLSVAVSVASGSPVQDQLDGSFTPTSFRLTVDATGAAPACVAAGSTSATTDFQLEFKSPNGIVSTVPLVISYPTF